LAVPASVSQERRIDCIERLGENSLEQVVRDSAQRFGARPSIEPLRAEIPKRDDSTQTTDEDGVMGKLKQRRLTLQSLVNPHDLRRALADCKPEPGLTVRGEVGEA